MDLNFDTETQFQTYCDGVLDKLKIHYYHISSKNRYLKKGIPDLLCWYKKKSFVIELKVGRNKLSEDQKKERDKFILQGIPHFVCYTPDDFTDALKKFI